MKAIECLMTRRSIRQYTDEIVSDVAIETMLGAAMAAPSARNTQPWHFYIIQKRETLDLLAAKHQYGKMLANAPLAILVCGNLDANDNQGYFVQDCSSATQNLLLAAHAQGLGAVWLGIYPREERMNMAREILNVPENLVPIALISIGHPAEEKPPSERFDRGKITSIK